MNREVTRNCLCQHLEKRTFYFHFQFLLSFSFNSSDKQLAFVVLGGEMVSKGGGVTHWKAMLEHPEEQVCEWQDMQLF